MFGLNKPFSMDTSDTKTSPTPDAQQKETTPKDSATSLVISNDVKKEMSKEINNMLSFAVFNGKIINTDIITLVQDSSVENLINAHNLLCKNVAPATPKSIEYTKELHQEGIKKSLFSKLPLVRNLVLLALFFLATFIITGISPEVNNESLDKGVMDNHGLPLLLNLGYLASVSGLGVLFYLLKNVSASVQKGTLVPEDSIYYIALIVLGVIAGLIMSEIISFYSTNSDDVNLFNKSVLALIGGFSSDAIFSVLQGLIDRIKAIFFPSNS